jgi:hypothetical protein
MYTLKIYKIDIDLYLEKKGRVCTPMITFDKTSHRLTVHDVTNLLNKKKSDDNYSFYFINSIDQ